MGPVSETVSGTPKAPLHVAPQRIALVLDLGERLGTDFEQDSRAGNPAEQESFGQRLTVESLDPCTQSRSQNGRLIFAAFRDQEVQVGGQRPVSHAPKFTTSVLQRAISPRPPLCAKVRTHRRLSEGLSSCPCH